MTNIAWEKLSALVLDIDGVCTNGQLTYNEQGISHMTFHAHDGQGIRYLIEQGWLVAVISGNQSPIIKKRMHNLGVEHIYLHQIDKRKAFAHLLETTQKTAESCVYVGDDLPDIPLLQQAGFACAVNNAMPAVKAVAHHVSQRSGGEGAVREIIDFVRAKQQAQQCATSSS